MRRSLFAPLGALVFLLAAAGLAACGDSPPSAPEPVPAPPEAHTTLNAFLTALKDGRSAEAVARLPEDQRKGRLGLSDDLPWRAEGKAGAYTAAMTLNILFFADVRDFEADPQKGTRTAEGEARIPARLLYADDVFADREFVLREIEGDWLLDLRATLELWHETFKESAFAALKPKEAPADE